MSISYALKDSGGNIITDSQSPPYVNFVTPTFTLPGTLGPTVTFGTVSRTVSIPEPNMMNVTTMSELFAVPENLPSVQSSVQYSEAIAFSVQVGGVPRGGRAAPQAPPASP